MPKTRKPNVPPSLPCDYGPRPRIRHKPRRESEHHPTVQLEYVYSDSGDNVFYLWNLKVHSFQKHLHSNSIHVFPVQETQAQLRPQPGAYRTKHAPCKLALLTMGLPRGKLMILMEP